MWPWKKTDSTDTSLVIGQLTVGDIQLNLPTHWAEQPTTPNQIANFVGKEGMLLVSAGSDTPGLDDDVVSAMGESIAAQFGPDINPATISFQGRRSARFVVGKPPVFLQYLIPVPEILLSVTYCFYPTPARAYLGEAIMAQETRDPE